MRLAVLASGNGSNLQALLDAAAADDDFGGSYALVVSDRPDALALQRAAAAGVATETIQWSRDRDASTSQLLEVLERHRIDAVVLAGFMRILGPAAIAHYPNRILNIHPSLLPAFPGADAIGAALAHGVRWTGVTVHFVDEEVDHGPIIAQTPVEVLADDDRTSLQIRIQAEEHVLYPAVVREFVHGRIRSMK